MQSGRSGGRTGEVQLDEGAVGAAQHGREHAGTLRDEVICADMCPINSILIIYCTSTIGSSNRIVYE